MSDTTAGILQVCLLIAALGLCYRPLGAYMARVNTSDHHTPRRTRHLPRHGRRPPGGPDLAHVCPFTVGCRSRELLWSGG